MKALFLAGAALAVPLSAQVSAPTAPISVPATPVAVPTTPVTVPPNPAIAPTAVPGPASSPGSLINPAVPTAAAPQNVGRTFQTTPLGGLPAPVVTGATDPNRFPPTPGFPTAVSVPTGTVAVTNSVIGAPFTGAYGVTASPFGAGVSGFTNDTPPFGNPFSEPVVVEFPPGTVVNGAAPNPTVGGLTPAPSLAPTPPPAAVGSAPGLNQGSAASPAARPAPVVRPQR